MRYNDGIPEMTPAEYFRRHEDDCIAAVAEVMAMENFQPVRMVRAVADDFGAIYIDAQDAANRLGLNRQTIWRSLKVPGKRMECGRVFTRIQVPAAFISRMKKERVA